MEDIDKICLSKDRTWATVYFVNSLHITINFKEIGITYTDFLQILGEVAGEKRQYAA